MLPDWHRWARPRAITYTDYASKALGGFSSSAYFQAPANSTIPFTPGTTLWLAVQVTATAAASWETLLESTDGAAYPSAKGFRLVRAGLDSGATAGKLILSVGGSLPAIYTVPTTIGAIVALCIVWKASDHSILVSANGGPQVSTAGPAAVSQDATCRARLGYSTFNALSTLRLLAYALTGTEASATQAAAGTYSAGSRYALPASVTSVALQEWQAARDWDGSASTSTTLGSSPIAYVKTGAPVLKAVSERRFTAASGNVYDSRSAVAKVDGSGSAYTIRRAYARWCYTSSAIIAAVEAYSTLLAINTQAVTGLYVNGTWTSETTAPSLGPVTTGVALGAGSGKAVDVWEGPQAMAGSSGEHLGTFVQAVRFPLLATDGTTAYTTTANARAAVQKRLVVFGDSIFCGFYATPMTENSLTALLRADFPTTGTGGVTCYAVGNESVHDLAGTQDASDATAAALIAECDGTSSNVVVCNLGTNDYGGVQDSAATFTANATRLLASIDAARGSVPGFAMIWYDPIARGTETANVNGATLGDIRAAIQGFAGAYAWLTVKAGSSFGLSQWGDYNADHIHPSDDTKFKATIRTDTGY